MAALIEAIRGMNDILPPYTLAWQSLERIVRDVVSHYGYQEIRFPIIEKSELFKRSVGEHTDIVEKEMYTFKDRNGDSLTLRPEGTASCIRAALGQGLLRHYNQRLWYMGPLFRHERPQKGRYRQFQQLGLESFGISNPYIDAELILIAKRLWQKLGLQNQLVLQLNTLGNIKERFAYRQALVDYFKPHYEKLDANCQRRLVTNPLRILDSSNPAMQPLIASAPLIRDFLSSASLQHFQTLCQLLDQAQLSYEINPHLVRGLDYYNDTVFEWTTDRLGAKATVCAGGRYDGLVEQLGGKPTPAVGFAVGMERLILLCQQSQWWSQHITPILDVYVIVEDQSLQLQSLILAEKWRTLAPHLHIIVNFSGGSFKTQCRHATKSGAKIAIVMTIEGMKQQTVTIKYFHGKKPQQIITFSKLAHFLQTMTSWHKKDQ